MTDDPKFLSPPASAPAPQPAKPELIKPAAESPRPLAPKVNSARAQPRAKPHAQVEPESEPGRPARHPAPGRIPAIIIRYPRLVGLAFIAFGSYGWHELLMVSARLHGGTEFLVVYHRLTPLMPALGFGYGGFLLVFGRPADARGYSPDWYNKAY